MSEAFRLSPIERYSKHALIYGPDELPLIYVDRDDVDVDLVDQGILKLLRILNREWSWDE